MRAVAIALFLSTLFIVLEVSVASEAPKGFRNFKWGDRPSADIKKYAGRSDGVTVYKPLEGKKLDSLYGVPVAEETYYFLEDRFYGADAWLDGQDSFDKMKTALIKEFGQPSSSDDSKKNYTWEWPNENVWIKMYYQPRFSRTAVNFTNDGI
jgi:hypothetical protein